MLGIAQRLRSPDQARIARDILADVATAEAAAPPATPASERDPSLDSLAPRTSVAPLRGGGFSVVTEPVSRVCIPCGVGGSCAAAVRCMQACLLLLQGLSEIRLACAPPHVQDERGRGARRGRGKSRRGS